MLLKVKLQKSVLQCATTLVYLDLSAFTRIQVLSCFTEMLGHAIEKFNTHLHYRAEHG